MLRDVFVVTAALICVIARVESALPLAKPIIRMSYGVRLYHEDTIHIAVSNIIHTFAVEFPAQHTMRNPSPFYCSTHRDEDECRRLRPIIEQTHAMYASLAKRLNEALTDMRQVISDSENVRRGTRSDKRALLSFVGDVIKGLTGMPSENDLNMMTNGINGLKQQVIKVAGSLAHAMDGQATFMHLVSQKEEGISRVLKLHDATLHNLTNFFMRNTRTEGETISLLARTMEHLAEYEGLREEVRKMSTGLKLLVNGILPPDLISPIILKDTIREIRRVLGNQRTKLFLIRPHRADIYSRHDFVVSRHGDTVYVALKFPVGPLPTDKGLVLYKVETNPVPVPGENHTTEIKKLPKYVAYSPDSEYYMEFEAKPVLGAPHILYLGHSNHMLKKTSFPNCIISLINEETGKVKELCDFSVKINGAKSQIIPIDISQIMLINVDHVTLECEGQRSVTKEGCSYCLMQIPCGCEVSWRDVYIPQQLGSCLRDEGTTVLHGINLRALQSFFSQDEIEDLKGNSLLQNELEINLPKIKLWEAKTAQTLAKIEQTDLDLDTLAAHAANDTTVYQSMEQVIWDNLEQVQAQIPLIKPWYQDYLMYSIGALAGIALLMSLAVGARVKMLTLSLGALRAVSAAPANATVTAPRVLNFFRSTTISTLAGDGGHIASTTTAVDLDIQKYFERLSNFEISVLVMLIMILALLIMTLKYKQKHALGNKFTLEMQVGCKKDCVSVTLMTLCQSPCHYKFTATKFVENIRVCGYIFTRLKFIWPTLKMEHKLTKEDYGLPTTIWINPYKAMCLRAMIAKEFWILVVTNDGHQINLIDLEGTTWQSTNKAKQKQIKGSCPTLNVPEFFNEDSHTDECV